MVSRAFKGLGILCALAPVGLGTLMVADAKDEQQTFAAAPQDLGDSIPGLTSAEEDMFLRGRRLFRWELWRPDPGVKAFNENECSLCHREPYFGGSNPDKTSYAPFVKDPSSPAGWKPNPRRQRTTGRFQIVAPPEGAVLRRAPSLFGIGLLEGVPQDQLLKRADPADSNKDGISGRPFMVGERIGRFGWKSTIPSVEAFTIDAFKNELGMSISSFDREDFGGGLGMSQIKAVTHFLKTLGPPPRSAQSKEGKTLFEKVQCGSCHTPSLQTGTNSIAALSKKTFEAYTDLLLHEMGDGKLHGNSSEVSDTEFRTAPLWGIGKFTGPYMHDGSAKSLEEAILKHGGEAAASRDKFKALSAKDQKTLVSYVQGL